MDQPPLYSNANQSNPSGSRKGCLGCVGILLLIPVILFVLPYLVLMHSSLPLKWVAKEVVESADLDGNAIDLKGVGGSISKGVTIKEITVFGDEGDSTIEGFKFQFNGLVDSIRNKRVIIEEISTERAEFIVAPSFFKDMVNEEEDAEPEETTSEPKPESEEKGELELFELRELRFENTSFRSVDGEVDVEVPLIRLAGLKVEGDDFELKEVEVISDHVTAELSDANAETIEGQIVPFTKRVSVKLLPTLHPAVKSDLDFSFEFAAINGETSNRMLAFGGALEQTLLPDGVSRVQISNLNIEKYLDCENLVIPQNFSMKAVQEDSIVNLEAGGFNLGETRFQTDSQQVDADDPEEAIVGRAEVGEYRIEAKVRPKKDGGWPPISVELVSDPKLESKELLALIYFQRKVSELTPEEKARVDRLVESQKAAQDELAE